MMGIYFHVDVVFLFVHILLCIFVVLQTGCQGSDVHLLLCKFVAKWDA